MGFSGKMIGLSVMSDPMSHESRFDLIRCTDSDSLVGIYVVRSLWLFGSIFRWMIRTYANIKINKKLKKDV